MNNKLYYVLVSHELPQKNTVLHCNRLIANRDGGFSLVDFYTDPIKDVSYIGNRIFEVETQEFCYIMLVECEKREWEVWEHTFVGMSLYYPIEGKIFPLTRFKFQQDGFGLENDEIVVDSAWPMGCGLRRIKSKGKTYYVISPF